MITGRDMYHVVAAMVPLYVAMMLGYMSVRWWKLLNVDECSGINKFVAKLSIPFLSFQVISSTNPYKMNMKLVVADIVQKMLAIIGLLLWVGVIKRAGGRRLKWIITGLSLTTLPNTLILGIPLLKAMYGDEAVSLLSQLVVLQTIIWYNILIFLFELLDAQSPSPEEEDLEEEDLEEEENRSRIRRRKSYVVVIINVVKKLLRNPNTHATSVGVIWACIHYSRWSIELPSIITNSILIVSQGGLGMAMFSLGLFMASRPSLIACSTRKAIMAMVLKFVAGPALMALASLALRLKGTSFKVALLQAALPQGIVPFVFAKQYNVHPDVLSTGVIFGMLLTLPISLLYYLLLAL